MKIKRILFTLMLVLVSLIIVAAVGLAVLFQRHTFSASVSGRIVDAEGRPIPGTVVTLHVGGTDASSRYFEGVTDESGNYFVRTGAIQYALDSSAAYCVMRISADGYVTACPKERIIGGRNINRDFEMVKTVSVSGRLVTPKGEPVAGSSVCFTPTEQAESGSKLSYLHSATRSGEDGSFKLDTVGPFEYRVGIHEHGNRLYRQRPLSSERVDLANAANREGLEIVANDPLDYTISGHVRDSEGEPVTDAFVWTINENSGT